MNWAPEPSETPLTVGALTQRIKLLLERSVGEVWVRGEVSNLRQQSSGHLYFTLKDAEAQLSAVIFRPDAARLPAPLREGMSVVAFGRISVYAPRGGYQLVARVIQPAGEGELRRRFEALKARLAAEGLFAAERKRPLPRLPSRIVLITSPTGAALRDFLSILRRRRWRGTVRLLPVRVQGVEAAPEIAAMLELANAHALGDLVVVTRGGGSLEDLWPFNEEAVARAVAASALPVISAVGHEIDFTLSDFAADVRAETPSAAAELISSEFVEFAESIGQLRRRLHQGTLRHLASLRLRLDAQRQTLRAHNPRYRVEQAWMRLDELAARRRRAWEQAHARARDELAALRLRLARQAPGERLKWAREHLRHLAIRLRQASPESALQRGYAIVRRPGGPIVARRADLPRRASIEVEWIDGTARFSPAKADRGTQLDLPLDN